MGKRIKKKWLGIGRNGPKPNLRSIEIGKTRRPVTCPLGDLYDVTPASA